MRRFTRLTTASSKKTEPQDWMVSRYTVLHNNDRIHETPHARDGERPLQDPMEHR
jgi:hypothetical protein